MDRKESIKTLLLGTASLPFLSRGKNSESPAGKPAEPMRSRWEEWPDMQWTGPQYWANRLQDWRITGGKAECSVSAPNRSLHCLTHQLTEGEGDFEIQAELEPLNQSDSEGVKVGFLIGARAQDRPVRVPFDDYRRNAVFGEGLHAGIDGRGRLFIGEETADGSITLEDTVQLQLKARPNGGYYRLKLSALSVPDGKELVSLIVKGVEPEQLRGNVALLSHFPSKAEDTASPSVRFANWRLSGSKVEYRAGQTFGPICFAQYTLNKGILKMTAQLTPVESVSGHKVELQIRKGDKWVTVDETTIHPLARTAHFRIEGWNAEEDTLYRVRLELPLNRSTEEYFYEGAIAAEPDPDEELKMAVFSCNSHYGFPNNEVVHNVSKHNPDVAMFLGDQIYESHGGFGVERTKNVEKAALDYLRKWYMFGWSYRDIFRNIPVGFIPDDHDVFHGNVWGQSGKEAPTDDGWGYQAQDSGGYKYPAEWVRMVERILTGHLPDPYDSTPVQQDISVYYTDWTYGGVSLAIIEDRKFKTAPQNALPEEAQVVNGFIQNPDFDVTEYYDIDAELLGERQLKFLQEWIADWSHGARMKAVLSQTNFCNLGTLPEGERIDEIVPRLPIPQRGEYVKGDALTTDMDTNGWPAKGRDEALKIIRKGFALHIAGDQHLASMVQYGVDEYGDAGFAFTGPALNNIWPRRWWPPVGDDHKPLVGRPRYTGNFKDAFNNRMTVLAVANPVQTNREPALIYDRVTGYGIVTFNTTDRTTRIECWPRYVDPLANPEGQYDGWPVVVSQEENYGRKVAGYLPEMRVEGMDNPVIQLYDQGTGELVYALRVKGRSFRPKVFGEGRYIIRVGDPDLDQWQEYRDMHPEDDRSIIVRF